MEHGGFPDLATILRTLKNPSEASRQQSLTPDPRKQAPEWVFTAPAPAAQLKNLTAATDPRRRPATPSPDPSVITTWTAAQKYVIDHIYRNEASSSKIKQLIRNQDGQERRWWAERETLVAKHKGRAEKEKQVAAMLKSMGGIAGATTIVNVQDDEAELQKCDKKIYAAMMQMASEIDRELRAMGVPFYAIKHHLVIVEADGKDRAGVLGRLDKGELRELQKRMLQLLEELFKE